jgi:ketosteroid isomerase-like protein
MVNGFRVSLSRELERLTAQVTDNLATVTYHIHLNWLDKNGVAQPGTLRIIHTWLRSAGGTWQIISGMSSATNAEGH